MEIFDDLEAEEQRIETILSSLDDASWAAESGARGWSVCDVVLHLGQTEEGVVATTSAGMDDVPFARDARTVEEAVDALVRSERSDWPAVFERWKTARRAALDTLCNADPERPLRWAAAPLKPRALATTRLAEHWAHGLDITGPLGIAFPDTARLRHIAWLAHRSLPYAFSVLGEEPHDVFCDLTGPDGESWTYGSVGADSAITGSAGVFCRVGARRVSAESSGLAVSGPHGAAALRALRNYAR